MPSMGNHLYYAVAIAKTNTKKTFDIAEDEVAFTLPNLPLERFGPPFKPS